MPMFPPPENSYIQMRVGGGSASHLSDGEWNNTGARGVTPARLAVTGEAEGLRSGRSPVTGYC